VYRLFYQQVLARIDAEHAHRIGVLAFAWGGWWFRLLGKVRGDTSHPRQAMGITFPGVMGLAAGMDKNAEAVTGLADAGFAFVEVGTVTPRAQPGNPKPRSWRELDVKGLRNQMGFNNDGADAMAQKLRKLRATQAGRRVVLGVNIGKNKVTDAADAAADYGYCARVLAPYADYLVVNVSSPNTPGLRDLQSTESLRPILTAAREGADAAVADRRVPLLVKIAPDLADADVDAVAALALELGLEGIVATNTTISHDRGPGGVSGPPVHARAVEVVRRLRAQVGPDLTIMGVGGIDTEADARELLDAGADLLQAYTGFVYNGPGWVAAINKAL
jgi:dihydroorotate dehydrogenase